MLDEKILSDMYTKSKYPEKLKAIIEQCSIVKRMIRELRETYQENGDLPMLPINSEYENLMALAKCMMNELMKYGLPGKAELFLYGDKDLQEICKDDVKLVDSGLNEWVEEGLLDRKQYIKKEIKHESLYKKYMLEHQLNNLEKKCN